MRERAQKAVFAIIFVFLLAFAAVCGTATGKVADGNSSAVAFDYSADCFEVRSSEDLAALSAFTYGSSAYDFSGKTVLLMSDVSAPSGIVFNNFNGTFRGNGFVIDGLNSSLFGTLGASGAADSFTLTGINAVSWPLANENKGTITDVTLYGTSHSAVVNSNLGTLLRVSAYMTVTAKAAFVSVNYGTIDSCAFSGDVYSDASSFSVLVGASGNVSAKIVDSAFNGRIHALKATAETAVTVFPFGDCAAERCSAVINTGEYNVVFSVTGTAKNTFVYDGTQYTVYGEDGTAGTDISAVTEGFYTPDGGIPFNSVLFDGKSGESGNELVIEDMNDVKKLVFVALSDESKTGFNAVLGRDVFGYGFSDGTGTPAFGTVKGTIEANGHIFAKTSFNPFAATSVVCSAPIEEEYGNDGYVSGENAEVSALSPAGSGTASDPYVITDAATLAGLLADAEKNATGKYAVAVKDIIVNNSLSADKYLVSGGADINLTIDFLGHALVNLYSAPFAAVNGSIKNLVLTLSSHSSGTVSYGFCREIAAGGGIERVAVYDVKGGTYVSGFAETSYGIMTLCHSGLDATNAFCAENYGEITNCSGAVSDAFVGGGTGTVSFCASDGKYVADDGAVSEGSGYFLLKAKGFDVDNVFGYEVGKSETAPVIRTAKGNYRAVGSLGAEIADFGVLGYDELAYTKGGFLKTDIENDACLPEAGVTAAFAWTYNGENHEGTHVSDVGTYSLSVTLSGDAYITETVVIGEINVVQAVYDGSIEFDSFADLNTVYAGSAIIDEPAPKNAEQLTVDGFAISYSVTKNGVAGEAFGCGTYIQTVTATSLNYKTLTVTRKIIVGKAALNVTVNDEEIGFGQEVEFTSFGENALTLNGAVGVDRAKTAKALVEESGYNFYSFFTTDYVKGNDVGSYSLNYTLKELDNYVLTVTAGALEVKPAVMDGCVFVGETFTYDGTAKYLSVEGAPAGAVAEYTGNGRTGAGSYTVTATVTHKNYVTFTKNAELKIEKATITFTVSGAEKDYGYAFDAADFSYGHSDTVGGDDYNTVVSGVSIAISDEYAGRVLDPGTYEVGLTITGDADNYRFETVKGTLVIGKAYLTALYPTENYSSELEVEYTGAAADVSLPEDAFGEATVKVEYSITKSGKTVTEIVEVGYYSVTATVTPFGEYADRYFVTVYTKEVTVTLVQTAIRFSQSVYTFVYDGTDFAAESNYPYSTEKIPEEGVIAVYFTQNGSRVTNIVHAGRYSVVAEFYGNGNLADARATATVTVQPREAILSVREEYDYSGRSLIPETEISYKTGESGNLSANELVYTYTDRYGATLNTVAEAGTYTLNVTSGNTDYTVSPTTFTIVINPLSVVVTQSDITFEYGAKGEYSCDGITINVGTNEIGVLGYEIAETGATVTFTFRLKSEDLPASTKYFPIGTYTVDDSLIVQPKNYRYTLSAPFTVEVTKRILSVVWTLDGQDVSTEEISVTYAGKEQNERVGYRITGFAAGESESNISVEKTVRQGVNEKSLLYVGEYAVSLTLTNSPYYVFAGNTPRINVTVTKATLLSIAIADGEVMQYENLPSPSVTVGGLRGEDACKRLSALRGYSFRAVTTYNPLTASVGETYRVSGEFTFADYTIASENIEPGVFTVVKGYKRYTLPTLKFVYDGTEKTVTISDVEDGVTVIYDNNAHTDVGRYEVTARVTYPTGRTEGLTSTLTITKATPIITCPDEYGIYIGDYVLGADSVNAVATLNTAVPVVTGVFTFNGASSITKGRNSLSVKFTPTDTVNFEVVYFTKNVTVYEVTSSALVYDRYDFTFDANGKMYLDKPLYVTLDKSGYVGAEDMISLYLNGSVTNRITLNRTAQEKVEIRYGQVTVYAVTLDVVYGTENEPDEPETVEINHKLLRADGIVFSDDGQTIYLESGSGKGYLSMADEYRSDFALYVNGQIVSGTYEITAETGEINVSIRSRKLGVSLYSANATVTTEKKPEENGESGEKIEDGNGGFKTYYYYIIAAVGAVVVVGVIILILKLRR